MPNPLIDALFGGPSWLEQANQQRQKDLANYLQSGVPGLMSDTQGTQGLAGGFGGTTTGKLGKAMPEVMAAEETGLGAYRGSHTAADAESGAPLHNVSSNGIYPEDFYGPNGFRYYGETGAEGDMNYLAYNKIRNMKDRPDEMVKVYRATPWEGKKPGYSLGSQHINPGDWVTLTKKYAIEHGESNLNGNYAIAVGKKPAKELFTSGDSIHEWGWSPQESKD